MTADIVNLRQARKVKARTAREKQAGENRLKFGRSKAERTQITAEKDLVRRKLDSLRRGDADED